MHWTTWRRYARRVIAALIPCHTDLTDVFYQPASGLGGDRPDGTDVSCRAGLHDMRRSAGRRLASLSAADDACDRSHHALLTPRLALRPRHFSVWFFHRLRIPVVGRRLGQQEHVLMRLGGPIRHALGHRVRLRPNDVGAQIPAVSLKRKRSAPRDALQLLAGAKRVAQIQEKYARRLQHAPHLPEHRDHPGHVGVRCALQAQLAIDALGAALAADVAEGAGVIHIRVSLSTSGPLRLAICDSRAAVTFSHPPPRRAVIAAVGFLIVRHTAPNAAVHAISSLWLVIAARLAAVPGRRAVVPQPPIGR